MITKDMMKADSMLHVSLSAVEDIEPIIFNNILTALNMTHFYFCHALKNDLYLKNYCLIKQ